MPCEPRGAPPCAGHTTGTHRCPASDVQCASVGLHTSEWHEHGKPASQVWVRSKGIRISCKGRRQGCSSPLHRAKKSAHRKSRTSSKKEGSVPHRALLLARSRNLSDVMPDTQAAGTCAHQRMGHEPQGCFHDSVTVYTQFKSAPTVSFAGVSYGGTCMAKCCCSPSM